MIVLADMNPAGCDGCDNDGQISRVLTSMLPSHLGANANQGISFYFDNGEAP